MLEEISRNFVKFSTRIFKEIVEEGALSRRVKGLNCDLAGEVVSSLCLSVLALKYYQNYLWFLFGK